MMDYISKIEDNIKEFIHRVKAEECKKFDSSIINEYSKFLNFVFSGKKLLY